MRFALRSTFVSAPFIIMTILPTPSMSSPAWGVATTKMRRRNEVSSPPLSHSNSTAGNASQSAAQNLCLHLTYVVSPEKQRWPKRYRVEVPIMTILNGYFGIKGELP